MIGVSRMSLAAVLAGLSLQAAVAAEAPVATVPEMTPVPLLMLRPVGKPVAL